TNDHVFAPAQRGDARLRRIVDVVDPAQRGDARLRRIVDVVDPAQRGDARLRRIVDVVALEIRPVWQIGEAVSREEKRFVFLSYENASDATADDPLAREMTFARWTQHREKLRARLASLYVFADAGSATTLRLNDGRHGEKWLTADGAFASGGPQIGAMCI